MSDEPDRSWIIGSPILMGVASSGLIVATLYPQGLGTSLECALLGGLIGLGVGILHWLWQ